MPVSLFCVFITFSNYLSRKAELYAKHNITNPKLYHIENHLGLIEKSFESSLLKDN